jgi:hypothetical protein
MILRPRERVGDADRADPIQLARTLAVLNRGEPGCPWPAPRAGKAHSAHTLSLARRLVAGFSDCDQALVARLWWLGAWWITGTEVDARNRSARFPAAQRVGSLQGHGHLGSPRPTGECPRGANRLNHYCQRARGWRGAGARGRAARGPVEPHGNARAPVGCHATGPAWVPAPVVIQRSEAIGDATAIGYGQARRG